VVKPIDPRFFSARVRLLLRLKNLEHQPLPSNVSLFPLAKHFKTE
jgi:hypothetical protein